VWAEKWPAVDLLLLLKEQVLLLQMSLLQEVHHVGMQEGRRKG
jgi:hypothetical protein